MGQKGNFFQNNGPCLRKLVELGINQIKTLYENTINHLHKLGYIGYFDMRFSYILKEKKISTP